MIWRDWIEELKDMGETLVAGLRGERPLTPLFIVHREGITDGFPLGGGFFTDDEARAKMVEFVKPLVYGAERFGWLLNADVRYLHADARVEMPECLVLAACDREVEETWAARIHRFGDASALGVWEPWPANRTQSVMLRSLQEALR